MINFEFDIKKVVQVINYILKLNDGKLNYTKLIKLLYIADKRLLQMSNFTITGDSYFSLPNGPILSNIYYLIKGNAVGVKQQLWDNFFTADKYDLILLNPDNNLTTGKLCKAERDLLNQIDAEFKDKDYKYMIDYTHKSELFPEVKWAEVKNEYTREPIPIEDILRSVGRSEDEISLIEQELSSQQNERKFFQACCS